MKEKIVDWNDDLILSGVFQAEERIVFDASGDAYTIVKTQKHGDFLLHSQDDMENWEVYPLPVSVKANKYLPVYRIEKTASDRPPVIFVLGRNSALSIIAPKKKDNGRLNYLNLITLVTNNASDGPSHSGVGDQTVTVANKTHIVYISTDSVKNQIGTPQYIVTYNHDNQTVTEPVLLATQGNEGYDHHNGPAIVADSQGYLHAVLGSHGFPFKYTVSKRPNDATEWEAAVEISNPSKSETYVRLVIDKANTLHLVSRMVDDEGYSLHYMRKKHNEKSWSDLGKLVVPKPRHYSVWYHKLTIDRSGRLFLAYFYNSHRLTDDELVAYHRKWPNEELEWNDDEKMWETNAHDPVILMSSDGGDSWKIATTPDFLQGPTVLAAEGKVKFLRVHDVGTGYGPPSDCIDVEVVISLDSEPDKTFGFQLRNDANEEAHRGMLDRLRDAFNNDRRVRIDYVQIPGLNNNRILRVMNTP